MNEMFPNIVASSKLSKKNTVKGCTKENVSNNLRHCLPCPCFRQNLESPAVNTWSTRLARLELLTVS
jgi:hypothetical protein